MMMIDNNDDMITNERTIHWATENGCYIATYYSVKYGILYVFKCILVTVIVICFV